MRVPSRRSFMMGSYPKLDSEPDCGRGPPTSDAEEQPLSKVQRQLGIEDLLSGALDVVLHPVVLHRPRVGVVQGEAAAVVVVAGLPDRADRDDVLVPPADSKALGHDIADLAIADGKGPAEVGVPDEGDF